ncbi:hypothetical protein CEUSTIGMA_g1244.t1 [Chlamydomonas eustigma]|uniref:Ubiquinone biosynthesis O-methyltransferase, mitochondrial n=1 Tax=Chlamydomonas eustigma TaxID=1157962 RepID=A0A250WSJ4_9CHLO|nr:hypothetical protein CEUSTIGMA_g1244.t1 [Chlamydomonas eustigma]|eukprot:GAX73793.1 hypothetical protein CEUSTIGMA_g1244.t1 [Chlamydomonas eustigma]
MAYRVPSSFLRALQCAGVKKEYPSCFLPWKGHLMNASTDFSQIRSHSSLDPNEAAKFAALSSHWWDASGPFAPLHQLNPARCKFICDAVCSANSFTRDCKEPLSGLKVLDVGCGGGILSESLARLGASVHGIDVTSENVEVAAVHSRRDPLVHSRVRYECIAAEQLADQGAKYDVVVASEVIEHVLQPDQFVKTLATLLDLDHEERQGTEIDLDHEEGQGTENEQPSTSSCNEDSSLGQGGDTSVHGASTSTGSTRSLLVLSTINRTPVSYAVAIVGAEYITGIVPRGTHHWERFITPTELTMMSSQAGLVPQLMAGMELSLRGPMLLSENLGVNYIASFARR